MPAALLIRCAAPAAAAGLLALALVVILAACVSGFLRISTCLELLRTLAGHPHFQRKSKQLHAVFNVVGKIM